MPGPSSAAAAPAVEVLVLGDLQVRVDGRAVVLPASRKTRALLGHLAVTGRPQPRERLCDLLWDGPGDPRAALRWSLAKLRPVVDAGRPRLRAEGDAVVLDLADATLDLAAVNGAVAGGIDAAPLERLRAAAARFRGELLEGLDLPDLFRFHEWCVGAREAARRTRLSILDALVARLEDADPEEALRFARERLAVDPIAEPGHVAVVRILGRLGRVREASEQYDTARHALATVLGKRPSAELERARLSATSGAGAAREPPRSSTAGEAGPGREEVATAAVPLVGRVREREAIARVVAAARGGARQTLLVLGEPGIGKTRLLEHLAGEVRRAGGIALRGRAFEAESLRPYGAWVDALREAPLAALPEIQRAELAPLLPELGERGPATDRTRLFDAVARALASLAAPPPLSVILDDLHWLDEASAALLHFVNRALEGAPVILAGAARPGELADNARALEAVRALGRAPGAARLQLSALAPAETAALVRAAAPEVDAARVHEDSEGNPLFALAVARARRGGEGTATLDELLAERLAGVTGRARDVIPWAAALGRSFAADLLARVAGIPATELLAAVEELERRGILRPAGDGGWDFAHDLVRRAAYAAISEPRRRLLHREVARAIATLPDRDGVLAGDVARHAALADDAELAAQASIGAGARAVRLCAPAEARELVERGLRFADRLPPDGRVPLSLALLGVAVDASYFVGGDASLLPRIRAVVEEARAAGRPEDVAAGYTILMQAHFARHDLAGTAEAGGLGADALRDVPPDAGAASMPEVAACLAALERDIPRARMLLEETKRLPALSPRMALYQAFGSGALARLEGDLHAAERALERAARVVASVPWEEPQVVACLAFLDLERRRPERALERAARLRELAPKLGEAADGDLADAVEAVARHALGDAARFAALEPALDRLERDAKARFAEAACAVAERELERGRPAEAARWAARAGHAAHVVFRPSLVVLAYALLARATLEEGDAAAAARHLETARRALTPAVPMARAARALNRAAAALDRPATPLPFDDPPGRNERRADDFEPVRPRRVGASVGERHEGAQAAHGPLPRAPRRALGSELRHPGRRPVDLRVRGARRRVGARGVPERGPAVRSRLGGAAPGAGGLTRGGSPRLRRQRSASDS